MAYDKELMIHKLQRWDAFVSGYHLPEWEAIPNFGLYMDQVIALLQDYLNFIPAPSDEKESFVTASTINNYVRLKIMPAPVKRKYLRGHIVYLIMILTLKLSLSISDIQTILPPDLDEAALRQMYLGYSEKFRTISLQFCQQMRAAVEEFGNEAQSADMAAGRMVIEWALTAGFNVLLAEKMIRLKDADPQTVLEAEQA